MVNFRPARLRDDGPPTISVASPARKHVAQLGIFEVTLEAMRMRLLSLRGTMCFVRGQTASRSRLGSVVHVVIAALLQQWLLPVSRELDCPSDQECRFVDDCSSVSSSTTNHDESGNGCCSGEGGSSGTTAKLCKKPEEGIIRIMNINKMMKMII